MHTLTQNKKDNTDMSNQLDTVIRCFWTALLTLKGWGALLLAMLLASRTGHLVLFLVIIFHVDMITGILAGRKEAKARGEKPTVYFLESKKMRQSIVKAVFYMMFVVLLYFVSSILLIRPIDLFFSEVKFPLYEIGLIICIGIEKFSILENFKRLGFDVIAKVKTIAKQVWSVIGAVKNTNNE